MSMKDDVMSVEREKFEALKESSRIEFREAISVAKTWQARAEALPSVSAIPPRPMPNDARPLEPKFYDSLLEFRPTYDNNVANEHFDKLEAIIDAQSSRIVELEKQITAKGIQ